jgi:hypothetical protein
LTTWEALLAVRQSPRWKTSSAGEKNFIGRNKVADFVSEKRITFDTAKQNAQGS